MLIDDSMFTLGSANLNTRSMAVDAEINVASDSRQCSTQLRKDVWGLHTLGAEGCNPGSLEEMDATFKSWEDLLNSNAEARSDGATPLGFLFPFEDKRSTGIRIG